jgi:hypothetical protein
VPRGVSADSEFSSVKTVTDGDEQEGSEHDSRPQSITSSLGTPLFSVLKQENKTRAKAQDNKD